MSIAGYSNYHFYCCNTDLPCPPLSIWTICNSVLSSSYYNRHCTTFCISSPDMTDLCYLWLYCCILLSVSLCLFTVLFMFLLFYGPSAWNKDWLIDWLNSRPNISAHFHMRAFRHIHRSVSYETAVSIAKSVGSRLDYCNSVLVGTLRTHTRTHTHNVLIYVSYSEFRIHLHDCSNTKL